MAEMKCVHSFAEAQIQRELRLTFNDGIRSWIILVLMESGGVLRRLEMQLREATDTDFSDLTNVCRAGYPEATF